MKIKNYGLAFGAILIVTALILCVFSQTKESPPLAKQEILTKLIPGEWIKKNPKSMESLADQIIKDNEELVSLFKSRNFKAMADFYAKRSGVIVTQGYKPVSGKDIQKFWEDAWTEGAELKFKTVDIYLNDQLGRQVREKATFNAVAFVIHEVSIIPEKGGDAYLLDSRVQCHQEQCPWRSCLE